MNRITVNKFSGRVLLARWGIVAGTYNRPGRTHLRTNPGQTVRHKPGTERVQLIKQWRLPVSGPLVGNSYPFPSGWSGSVDMYANVGSNTVAINNVSSPVRR